MIFFVPIDSQLILNYRPLIKSINLCVYKAINRRNISINISHTRPPELCITLKRQIVCNKFSENSGSSRAREGARKRTAEHKWFSVPLPNDSMQIIEKKARGLRLGATDDDGTRRSLRLKWVYSNIAFIRDPSLVLDRGVPCCTAECINWQNRECKIVTLT